MRKNLNLRQKLAALEKHYKLEPGTKTPQERSTAIKNAANSRFDSIEQIYERVFGDKPPPKTEDKRVEVLPPKDDDNGDDHGSEGQAVRVTGPTLHFHMTPGQVEFNGGADLGWYQIVCRSALLVQVFTFGLVVGLLASGKLIRLAGM